MGLLPTDAVASRAAAPGAEASTRRHWVRLGTQVPGSQILAAASRRCSVKMCGCSKPDHHSFATHPIAVSGPPIRVDAVSVESGESFGRIRFIRHLDRCRSMVVREGSLIKRPKVFSGWTSESVGVLMSVIFPSKSNTQNWTYLSHHPAL